MNLYEEIEKIKASGYSEQNAQSKLGQDIVLKAIADSGMAQNVMFTNTDYLRELHKSDKNWLDIPDEAALEKDLAFIKSITF